MTLSQLLAANGYQLSDQQLADLETYKALVLEKNQVMNLTSITDSQEFDLKHFLDSLLVSQYVDLDRPQQVLDLGTGAGFPGIPLKIAYPALDLVLLDSLKKRLTFLDQVIDQLGLAAIQTLHGRAEEVSRQPAHRDHYGLVLSRAVARLNTLVEWALPLVEPGGYFVSMKGADGAQEAREARRAMDLLGGRLEDLIEYSLGATDQARSLIIIKKVRPTPRKYPRAGGKPVKNPL